MLKAINYDNYDSPGLIDGMERIINLLDHRQVFPQS
jgi:hypothetical protein